jgi:hypothetical protein
MENPENGMLGRRLAAVERRHTAVLLVRGAARALLALCGVTALGVLLELLFRFGVPLRTALALVLAAAAAGVLLSLLLPVLRRLRRPLRERTDEVASGVGDAFPAIRDRLRNALELERSSGDLPWYSRELTDTAVARAVEEWRGLDFSAAVSAAPARRAGAAAAGAVTVLAVLLLVLPPARDAAGRLWHFHTPFESPRPFSFVLEPGDREILRGESVPVTVRVIGAHPPEIILASRPEGQTDFEEQVLRPGPDGLFRDTLESLKATTAYRARQDEVESSTHTLTVVERPAVRSLRLELTPPAYTGRPAVTLDDNVGDAGAVRGTRISFRIDANIPLQDAALVFSDGTREQLAVVDRLASGRITLRDTRTYSILLHDAAGRSNTDPIMYRLTALADAPPVVTVLLPGADVDVAGRNSLALLVRIADDYGFSALRLFHRLTRSRYEQPAEVWTEIPLPLPPPGVLETDVPFTWDFSGLNLVPEDVVSYFLEVRDNNSVSGPGMARSPVFTLRLPSLEEVFADADRGAAESMEGMEKALEQAREAREELEKLRQDLRREQEKLSWEQQQQSKQMTESYRDAQQKVEQAAEGVQRMLEEMEQNRAFSPETIEKYRELQQLMEEMQSPELAEALRKMQEAMEQLSPEAMRDALKNLAATEEMFRKSIERTMQLLKRLRIEQAVDELVRRAEELERRQEELARATEQAAKEAPRPTDDLASRQEELRAEQQRMAEELAGLREKMEEFSAEMPLEDLAAAERELEESGLDSLLQESAQDLAQQQPSRASSPQRSALQKMSAMKQRMQAMQQSLRENQQQQVLNRMRQSFEDLLELSRRQEELRNATRGLDPSSPDFRRNAQEQMEIMQDLGRVTEALAQLSNRTFGITPEMGKAIGDALRKMNGAQQSLEQRNGSAAGQEQGGAMGSLNEAAGLLQGAMNGMMQGQGSGMGMASFMQRMQQLSGMQQGVNQGTQGMGGMTPQQAAAMGRLAAEQGMVRKSLEQLAREAAGAGELSRMLGDLQNIAKEMREVQTDLAQGAVTPQTLEKQQRILSRMLDAQRSMQERDYEQQRRAESGRSRARSTPRTGDPAADARSRLQQDLLRALDEGFAPEYQELIRQYFEALQRDGSQR